jgi:hypothetical protein
MCSSYVRRQRTHSSDIRRPQNGVLCLTWVVRKDIDQLLSWHDDQGRSGIDNVLAVIAKLLANEDESGGLVIGDLIIHLLRRASSAVISVLPDLLQAMVRRMLTAKTATFVQVRGMFSGVILQLTLRGVELGHSIRLPHSDRARHGSYTSGIYQRRWKIWP